MSFIHRKNTAYDDFFYLHDRAVTIDPAMELKPGDVVTAKWFNRMLEVLGLSLRVSAGQNLTEMSRLAVEELKALRPTKRRVISKGSVNRWRN